MFATFNDSVVVIFLCPKLANLMNCCSTALGLLIQLMDRRKGRLSVPLGISLVKRSFTQNTQQDPLN